MEAPPSLSLSTERDGAAVVVAAAGEVDLSNRQLLLDAGELAITHADDAGALVVDLAAVTFMDSSGLGALVRLLRAASRRALRVAVVVEHPLLVRLLAMTGVDKVYPVVTSREQALVA